MTDRPELPEAELAALADGSLPTERRARLRARVDASPELTAALAEQARAVAMLRALDEPAPSALLARVHEMSVGARPSTRRRGARRRRRLLYPAMGLLAVAVAAIVVALGGGSALPTIPETAHLALAAATARAPVEDAVHRDQLRLRVGGLAFPYYGRSAGWETVGARSDRLHGRRVVTVFYMAGGARVGYAIVGGPPLPVGGGELVIKRDVRYWLQRAGSASLITWRKSGHTCVIAGSAVSPGTLVALASTEERQTAG